MPVCPLPSIPSISPPSTTVFRSPFMAAHHHCDSMDNYPVPLSPPLPLISKDIELNRAMSASSKSSLFSLSRSDVLHEDEWLIALNKPQGVYCETILSSVQSLVNDCVCRSGTQSKKTEFHLANRLDRDTSGVILVTKLHKVAAKLVKAFTDHKVRKTYIASCVGQAPKWKKMTIKSGHGRSKFGAWRVYAAKDVGRTLPGGSSVRDMETLFEVLSINGDQCNQESSEIDIVVEEKSSVELVGNKVAVLVRAYPRSGRTHQIRLHCQYLGIPVKGDVKYEGVYEWNGRVYDGHQLHAESLSFEHPVTGSSIVINAPLPSWATQG
ncbi:putative 23S rRNA pseudouridine(955/2504/2580) synthase [Helianthus annuus]|uniref:23S rRNA pseudouridine(955/2504/2580) synthase n=1 Tax=Helianthus annuus TaxID=4232 RepID=A0A251TCQ4_HELAN|nr:RNA pseudouridine synthase 1 [Helianthus annuus]KAF5803302.1 putative 23S rRNA pseudouridine(955/2504/2580) synthase [Helianthus annuus]KAJ0567893.1 putative 23S rRNA pseudouridine(955/2504/2580) synthase [Helianthus annuus]KAJ0574338.1 putative 23S rRNA pseudouridine(955/2504/2580) synthase [Helianthus annuus]KAJ0738674.1 putative 23S rRNA pseudouridine(955/2504/2580) synthase [Helianthus annuus]KAJ0741560.1 putative 23S rRNA pseudouridine(955/2504/2580) synthase [Helianthus annuus]